ncbi:MAG: iron-containing redox enzyme family protein [Thermoanaerobaculia bacterium]
MPSNQSLDGLCNEIESHPVFANPYFDSLQRSAWTRDTYDLHRANFFYRTELTVKTIAHVCARAADIDDMPTLILFTYILNEECGNGELKDCHAVLMEGAHNLFGRTAFDLEPLAVTAAGSSPLIAEGTNRYRKRLQELASGSYQCLLGVAMALESHASRMLTHCRTAFRAHAERFDRSQFVREVEVYFNVHLDRGVEERHAADATHCVRRNCRTEADLAEVRYGAQEMLNVQLDMWQDLHRRATALQSQRLA